MRQVGAQSFQKAVRIQKSKGYGTRKFVWEIEYVHTCTHAKVIDSGDIKIEIIDVQLQLVGSHYCARLCFPCVSLPRSQGEEGHISPGSCRCREEESRCLCWQGMAECVRHVIRSRKGPYKMLGFKIYVYKKHRIGIGAIKRMYHVSHMVLIGSVVFLFA